MPKRKTKLQKRINQLVREKYELLRQIEELRKERDDEPGPVKKNVRRIK